MINAARLQQFIPFEDLSENALQELLPHFAPVRLAQRGVLFKRGQQDDRCHYLLEGAIDLVNDHFEVTQLNGEDEGNFLALDATHLIHKYSAVAVSDCLIASLPRRYLELISTWVEVARSLESDEETDWLEALLTSELFNRIPPGNIQQLLSRFEEREVTLGDVLIQEDDEGNECYVIKQGKAVVTRRNGKGKQEETLAALSNGALFGEDSLISSLPRSATITMSSNGIVMVLSKNDFDTLLKTPVLEYVDPQQLDELIENSDTGVIQLDVRTQQEAAMAPVARARNVPLAQLRSQMDNFNRDFIYVVLGEGRAEAAAYILSEAGFEVKILRH